MSKLNASQVMHRYWILVILMMLVGAAVLAKAIWTMTAQREYWHQVADMVKKDSVAVKPTRGNILSCDGQLMASSLPEFKIFMDFVALTEAGNDSLYDAKEDSICMGLHRIFPSRSAEEFRTHLRQGREKKSRHWAIWPRRISYNTYVEVKQLPLFAKGGNASGFHEEEYNARKLAFGSLAGRTLGAMYGAKDTARFGLEQFYDSVLRGKDGIVHRRKVRNRWLNITDTPAVDGADIVTTIDVGMQDLAERAVIDELKLIGGDVGVAIVMEVKTGDIKALVNMDRCADGEYREVRNHAVSDLLEPGSVFKTASILVALDNEKTDTGRVIDTGGGIWPMYGREMRDHNWRRGGYGSINVARGLEVSSNIVVSRVVDGAFHNNPEAFVEGIYRTGLADDLGVPLKGATPARIRMPKKNKHGQWLNWSATALPWMSIGYETAVPPLSTLTFYNAIANGGKMMRPRFVQRVVKDGQTLVEYPPQVMRESIAKESTIKTMQTLLRHVVSQGLGKKAGSDAFQVAGKTGTAQISKGAGGYKSGVVHYLLSFAGYFPADDPRYSCIVCIQKSGLPASGGGMSGVVFHHIAEGIMAQDLKLDVTDARDHSSVLMPEVKNGNILAADYVLSHLGFNVDASWDGSYAKGNPVWGTVRQENKSKYSLVKQEQYGKQQMPDVTGMGARDAVLLIESRGVKTTLVGRGKVVRQSLQPGHAIKRGEVCQLVLE